MSKDQQPQVKTSKPSYHFSGKFFFFKVVLIARNLKSFIDESKGHWRIEPIRVKRKKIIGKNNTTADTISVCK